MERSYVQLTDLPDEILIYIFKKLDNIILLYSLSGVNIRLNKIIYDFIFTNRLTLLISVPIPLIELTSISNYYIYPLPCPMLDCYCLHILPKIHQNVTWLDLESSSMERILLATNYPHLSGIAVYNIQAETAIDLFSDERLFTSTYKNQISALVIDINTNIVQDSTTDINNNLLFAHICTTFVNLRSLIFCPSSIGYQYLSFDILPPTIISSTLLELHLCLIKFCDCLYLLDGHFNQLRIFHVKIAFIDLRSLIFNKKEKLPNIRSFRLSSHNITYGYDELILPLLHRMTYLEELDLSLIVWTNKTFIDGNNLKLNILNHIPLLNKFTFNIVTSTCFYNEINLPSNAYIQQTFKDFQNKQIISSVDNCQENKYSQCHIYSYPYQLKNYDNITNNFPGGIFKTVRRVTLFDERPFEHDFFLRITHSFPFMEKLTVINNKRQYNKLVNKNQDLSIIEYPYLIELDLSQAHKDYYQQFLFDTKTCLPNDVRVTMDYRLVKKVTRNFRRNATRSNSGKVVVVYFLKKSKFPEHLKDYFPHAQIR